jgi:hypothetical protein
MRILNEDQGPYAKTTTYIQRLMSTNIYMLGEICGLHSNNNEDFCIWNMVPCSLVEMY